MTIVNPLPFNLTDGTTADATQVMADFNEIRNDVNANAAHNGANNDITSLTGLTIPLSVAQGGTGQTTLAAAAPSTIASFSVHNNGVSGSFGSGVWHIISYSTEIYDVGSHFSSNRWTPPAGTISLSAAVTDGSAGANGSGYMMQIAIYKNGSAYKQVNANPFTSPGTATITIQDQCNGTDYYEAWSFCTANDVISGATNLTWFMGSMI